MKVKYKEFDFRNIPKGLTRYPLDTGELDPLHVIGMARLRLSNRWGTGGDYTLVKLKVIRFLERVALHIQVSRESDATEVLYREIDKR